MATIFLSYASSDHPCIDEIRQEFEVVGYAVWRAQSYPTPSKASYPYMIENTILGSVTVSLLWSRIAASSAWSHRHILIAQRFSKPLVTLRLDETALPSMLLGQSLSGQQPCRDLIKPLLACLLPPGKADPLLSVSEQIAHTSLATRKAAIDQAAALLQRGEHREEVLTILEYLARNDLMTGVREKAQVVFAATTQPKNTPASTSTSPQNARHFTTLSHREICSQSRPQETARLYEQTLPLMREVSDYETATLNHLAVLCQSTSRLERALILYEQALSLKREVDNRAGEATILNNLVVAFQSKNNIVSFTQERQES